MTTLTTVFLICSVGCYWSSSIFHESSSSLVLAQKTSLRGINQEKLGQPTHNFQQHDNKNPFSANTMEQQRQYHQRALLAKKQQRQLNPNQIKNKLARENAERKRDNEQRRKKNEEDGQSKKDKKEQQAKQEADDQSKKDKKEKNKDKKEQAKQEDDGQSKKDKKKDRPDNWGEMTKQEKKEYIKLQKQDAKPELQQNSISVSKPVSFSKPADWGEMSKQEKKDHIKLQKQQALENSHMTDGDLNFDNYNPNAPIPSPKPTKKPKKDKPEQQSDNFVQGKPNKTPRPTPNPTKRPEKDPTSNNNNDGMINTGSSTNDPFKFTNKLKDNSIQLDNFEHHSDLSWEFEPFDGPLNWSADPSQYYEGKSSIKSGISAAYSDMTLDLTGVQPQYSNLTFTTDEKFNGGVLTFQLLLDTSLPNDAFIVEVDGKAALTPPPSSAAASGKWVEYSVPVPQGQRIKIKFVHIYNPFGLESLPPRVGVPSLWMDDLRLSPFIDEEIGTGGFEYDGEGMEMKTFGDTKWTIDDGTSARDGAYSIVASSNDISKKSGDANVQFVLHSEKGGRLSYMIRTSTTAPFDDFVVLLNDVPTEAVFGSDTYSQEHIVMIPEGKQVVTFRHRKNPGDLKSDLLKVLGNVDTEGKTWVDDVTFVPSF